MTSLSPNDADWRLAGLVHRKFAGLPGAQHIASRFALAYLAALLRQHKILSVLEIGAGIGTITHLLLHQSPDRSVVCTEHHPFCIQALRNNISNALAERMMLITDDRNLTKLGRHFDLVIFDGLLSDETQYGVLGEGSLCFIEGSRKSTRLAIEAHLNERGLTCEFTRHHQGKRWLPIEWRRTGGGIPYPRPKFARTIKGFWLGRVARLQVLRDAA